MSGFTEPDVEDAALAWFEELGYAILHGPDIAPEEPGAERDALLPKLMSGEVRVRGNGL